MKIRFRNKFKFFLHFIFLFALELIALHHSNVANATPQQTKTTDEKFNYRAVCVFTDFINELIPPIDESLVKSKNTKVLDSEWVKSLGYAHPETKYYFHRTETGIELYFLHSPETANYVTTSVPGKLLPLEMQKPEHLAWLFNVEVDYLAKEVDGLGCESIDFYFDISKNKKSINRANFHLFVD